MLWYESLRPLNVDWDTKAGLGPIMCTEAIQDIFLTIDVVMKQYARCDTHEIQGKSMDLLGIS